MIDAFVIFLSEGKYFLKITTNNSLTTDYTRALHQPIETIKLYEIVSFKSYYMWQKHLSQNKLVKILGLNRSLHNKKN